MKPCLCFECTAGDDGTRDAIAIVTIEGRGAVAAPAMMTMICNEIRVIDAGVVGGATPTLRTTQTLQAMTTMIRDDCS